jgi:nitrous oxide reductase
MNTSHEIEALPPEDSQSGSSRRSFLKGAAFTGATTLAALGGASPPQPQPSSTTMTTTA